MSDSRIAHLRLRVPAGHLAAARMRVEDAMRLADTDDRLLLLRRLDLGRVRPDASPLQWAARTAERVQAQRMRAMHAMTPGAASADAVWFQSAEEAWTLLLLELARGRMPSAWFWRLAVRDWNGASLRVWLPRLIAEIVWDAPREVALARTIVRALTDGALDVIVAALAAAPMPILRSRSEVREAAPAATSPVAAEQRIEDQARRLLARLDPVLRRIVLTYLATARTPANPAVAWLLRWLVISVAPELVAHPTQLAALCDAVLQIAQAPSRGEQPVSEANVTEVRAPHRRSDHIEQPIASRAAHTEVGGDTVLPEPVSAAPTRDALPEADRTSSAPAAKPVQQVAVWDEVFSPLAGLFLLVRPLIRMGLPEWLEQRPHLAAEGFARALLRCIARRFRIADDDPVLVALGPEEDTTEIDHLTAWRVGLDRWLRRRARIKLAEVVRKRGWVTASEDAVTVRFRVEAAELRLRRLALDIDPGWVPFLGMVIRYHYRDEPLG